ncbi:hypothetical protein JW905_13590 [bacterium]|nr:hypothetical protein [candidate division CSSED10-310 bacterium]
MAGLPIPTAGGEGWPGGIPALHDGGRITQWMVYGCFLVFAGCEWIERRLYFNPSVCDYGHDVHELVAVPARAVPFNGLWRAAPAMGSGRQRQCTGDIV